MKNVILLISLFSISSMAATTMTKPVGGTVVSAKDIQAETRDCQVQNGPGVIMYGLCYKEGDTVIFKSCADFTCRLDKDVVAEPREAGKESCFTDRDPAKFKTDALAEHKVNQLSNIHNCGYGDKKRGEE